MLERGRTSFDARRWSDAHTQLTAAAADRALGVDDLERLAITAHLLGRHEERADALARAYHASLDVRDHARAARFAFWSGQGFVESGERSRALGWFARTSSLVTEHQLDGAEKGYALVPRAFQVLEAGETQTACDMFAEAAAIGERGGDADLAALARHAEGRCLIHMGRADEGIALLDEAMVAITAGEVSPLLVGLVYCSVIEACKETYDLRRAQEWTAALDAWTRAEPDHAAYRGQCRVFRAELMRLHGAWPAASVEAERARGSLRPDHPAVGAALYQQGELHRLRGEPARAEESYRAASAAGHDPQPGLALLRLAQGQADVALASIRRVVDETHDALFRSRHLPALVEIALEAGDADAAREGADELKALAERVGRTYLTAIAAHAAGMVRTSAGDAAGAIALLRRAWSGYRDCEAPYDAARVRELLGLSLRKLGDADAAEMELDAARSAYEQLSAGPDAARVARLQSIPPSTPLTARELEVVVLIARGKTNRAVAEHLGISEKTVARHVSNIFTKLDIPSRSALTAYAYEHDLV